MGKRILIDLTKFRACKETGSCDKPQAAGVLFGFPEAEGLKTIRELAVFQVVCRKCEDAPCIEVCPCEALDKTDEGYISRAINLCISCKSCVTICPFGTLMTDFFRFKTHTDEYFDLNDDNDTERFISSCPEGSVEIVETGANEQENIYELNEKILIKDIPWDKLKD